MFSGMADHTIRMQIPWQELGGRDVAFEVRIDGVKRGELHISEGGVDWYPRHARTRRTTSWTKLADFLDQP